MTRSWSVFKAPYLKTASVLRWPPKHMNYWCIHRPCPLHSLHSVQFGSQQQLHGSHKRQRGERKHGQVFRARRPDVCVCGGRRKRRNYSSKQQKSFTISHCWGSSVIPVQLKIHLTQLQRSSFLIGRSLHHVVYTHSIWTKTRSWNYFLSFFLLPWVEPFKTNYLNGYWSVKSQCFNHVLSFCF